MYKIKHSNKFVRLFDVTLRDGLQSVSKMYNLDEKKLILDNIIMKHPQAIEIGSIVSPKILPQMNNSIELYNYANEYNSYVNKPIDFYMLTPNLKSLKIACSNNIENFSLITSVSDAFQQKNINKTLVETKSEIRRMMENIETIPGKKKLYISCINKCPIQGKINHIRIVDEIIYYYYIYENLDEICLSDTCGTLSYTDFKEIIRGLEKRQIKLDKFSLHLHNQGDGTNNNTTNTTNTTNTKNNNVREIILYAMKKGIYRFDVSNMPELGGCSVTMKNPTGNISYEQIYENVD